LGFAINWSQTNEDTLQTFLDAGERQVAAELYYNMQWGDHVQITPDIQYIKDPAFSSESHAWVFGIRARIFI
jgi:porin